MATDTRRRMIEAAVSLLQKSGYRATSWRTLTEVSGTPWGSVQHHFPGGKEELGVAAIRLAGESVDALIADCMARGATPSEGIRQWFTVSADLLASSAFVGGCPVAPVVLEMSGESTTLRTACAEILATWTETIASTLRASGIAPPTADRLASTAVAAFEGAMILARASQDTTPLDHAATSIVTAIDAVLPG